MEHIWAPWRMAYIKRDGPPDDEGCFLCAKPRQQDDAANLILARGERCFVIMNLFPYNSGHLMIAPYAHVPTIEELAHPRSPS
jgi:ATP adenylyltransferase